MNPMKKLFSLALPLLLFSFVPLLNQIALAETNKEQAAAFFEQGMNKYLAGDSQGAIHDLEKVIELDPQHEQARTLLSILMGETASSYFIQGDYAHALPLLEKLRKILPEDQSIRRMYEQAKKGLGTMQRSEDIVKFLQKQQQSITQQAAKAKLTPPRKQPAAPSKKPEPAVVVATVAPAAHAASTTTTLMAINEEVNRRILLLQKEMEKKQLEAESRLSSEKRDLFRKFLLWGGGIAFLGSIVMAFLALSLYRQSRLKKQILTLKKEPAKTRFPQPEIQETAIEPSKLPEPESEAPQVPIAQINREQGDLIYNHAIDGVRKIFKMVQNWDLSLVEEGTQIASDIVSALQTHGAYLIEKAMTPYEEFPDHLFAHSVNVAILSCYLKLNDDEEKLKAVALSGILHDIGVSEKLSVLHEPRRLGEPELEIMRIYRKSGAWILKNCEDQQGNQSPLFQSASKVLETMHHSNPFVDVETVKRIPPAEPKKESETDPFVEETAMLLGLVETFEALTHERPYRSAYSPAEAINMMKERAQFNPHLKNSFSLLIEKLNLKNQLTPAVAASK